MHRRRIYVWCVPRAAIAFAFAVAVAACSDDPAPALDEPLAFLTQVRAAECDTMVRCRIFGSQEQCDVFRDLRLPLPWGVTVVPDVDWIDALAEGTAVYSPEDAAACLAAWRGDTCRRSAALDRCATAFRGIALGGATTSAREVCSAGFWEESVCSNACCVGRCGRLVATPPRPEGTPCVAGAGVRRCDANLTCVLGRCARLTTGDVCGDDLDCPPDLVCEGRCRPRLAIGDTCGRQEACGDLGAYCGTDQRCRRLPTIGERCDDGLCAPGLACDLAGRCAGFGYEGGPCEAFGVAVCGRGLHCDPFTATCAPQLPEGAGCTDSRDCSSGVCGDAFTCGAPCPS
jgi:hypothetical protein